MGPVSIRAFCTNPRKEIKIYHGRARTTLSLSFPSLTAGRVLQMLEGLQEVGRVRKSLPYQHTILAKISIMDDDNNKMLTACKMM